MAGRGTHGCALLLTALLALGAAACGPVRGGGGTKAGTPPFKGHPVVGATAPAWAGTIPGVLEYLAVGESFVALTDTRLVFLQASTGRQIAAVDVASGSEIEAGVSQGKPVVVLGQEVRVGGQVSMARSVHGADGGLVRKITQSLEPRAHVQGGYLVSGGNVVGLDDRAVHHCPEQCEVNQARIFGDLLLERVRSADGWRLTARDLAAGDVERWSDDEIVPPGVLRGTEGPLVYGRVGANLLLGWRTASATAPRRLLTLHDPATGRVVRTLDSVPLARTVETHPTPGGRTTLLVIGGTLSLVDDATGRRLWSVATFPTPSVYRMSPRHAYVKKDELHVAAVALADGRFDERLQTLPAAITPSGWMLVHPADGRDRHWGFRAR